MILRFLDKGAVIVVKAAKYLATFILWMLFAFFCIIAAAALLLFTISYL